MRFPPRGLGILRLHHGRKGSQQHHHSIAEYRGLWILFYHRWLDTPGHTCCTKLRHVAAEYLRFNEDGTIQKVQRTTKGVSDFVDQVRKD
jgi:hypothetical protein